MKNEYLIEFSKRLRIAIKSRGYTSNRQFATAIGCNPTTIENHKIGIYDPSVIKALEYAQFLDISLTWFFTGKGSPLDHLDDPDPKLVRIFKCNQIIEDAL